MIHIPVLPLGLFIVGASSAVSAGYMIYDDIRLKQEEAWFKGEENRNAWRCKFFLTEEEEGIYERLKKECDEERDLYFSQYASNTQSNSTKGKNK